jgi:hypothetical protein
MQELLLKCVVIKTLFKSKITLNGLTSATCEQGNGELPLDVDKISSKPTSTVAHELGDSTLFASSRNGAPIT